MAKRSGAVETCDGVRKVRKGALISKEVAFVMIVTQEFEYNATPSNMCQTTVQIAGAGVTSWIIPCKISHLVRRAC